MRTLFMSESKAGIVNAAHGSGAIEVPSFLWQADGAVPMTGGVVFINNQQGVGDGKQSGRLVRDLCRRYGTREGVLRTHARIKLQELNTPMPDLEMWAFPMQMGQMGAGGALVKLEGMAPGGNGVLIYFSCEDCAVEAERIAGGGGMLDKPKFPIGEYGFIAIGIDTEGNMFGLHSLK